MVGHKQDNKDMVKAIREIQVFVQAGRPLREGLSFALATPGQSEGTRGVLKQLEQLCTHLYQRKEKITRESLDTQLQRILPTLPQTRAMITHAITKEKPGLFFNQAEMMTTKALQVQIRAFELHLTSKCQQAALKGELAITRSGYQPTSSCSSKTQALLGRYQVIHEVSQAVQGKKALNSGDMDMVKKSIAKCSAMNPDSSDRSFMQKLFSGNITQSFRDRMAAERQLAKGIEKAADLLDHMSHAPKR